MRPRHDDDGRILSLDIATETGWCIGRPSDTKPYWGSFKNTGGALPNSLILHDAWLTERLTQDDFPIDLVVIEAAPSIRWGGKKTNANTLLKLNGLCAKTEEVCARLRIDCRQLTSQKWKSALCGPIGKSRFGKSDKPYPPFEALALRGWQLTNHNAADAVGLWLFTVGRRAPTLALRFDPLVMRATARGQRR